MLQTEGDNVRAGSVVRDISGTGWGGTACFPDLLCGRRLAAKPCLFLALVLWGFCVWVGFFFFPPKNVSLETIDDTVCLQEKRAYVPICSLRLAYCSISSVLLGEELTAVR